MKSRISVSVCGFNTESFCLFMLGRADLRAGAAALQCFASCHFPAVPRRTKTHNNLSIFHISDVLVRATFVCWRCTCPTRVWEQCRERRAACVDSTCKGTISSRLIVKCHRLARWRTWHSFTASTLSNDSLIDLFILICCFPSWNCLHRCCVPIEIFISGWNFERCDTSSSC